jgi:putative DNA methylase
VPDEEIDSLSNYDRGHRMYGMFRWTDLFSPRQLYGHCVSVEVFQDLVQSVSTDLDRAALAYLALAIDKVVNYNSVASRWDTVRVAIRGKFDQHNYTMQWSYGEMAPTIVGLGYDWAVEQTGKALSELIDLLGQSSDGKLEFAEPRPKPAIRITSASADALPLEDASVDCVVMDPPYYDNVMYAELSDFFYVWLKRTAGLLYPELFTGHLTDKDREAVANAAKFAGQKGGAKNLAGKDYQRRMASIFKEQRRVLKPDGIMTVMFTHKAAGAWDALAGGLIEAGFTITASWPVNTEAEGSLHIREKSAARSTIFLVCRVREADTATSEPRYWEEVEPTVRQAVRAKVKEFQVAGIGGIDLYLACFGPALQVFTEAWPLTRGTARPQPKTKQRDLFEEFDPYSVRPEDALEAARREVKQWRIEQLATVKRQHHLDALTEWYVLAWDAFRAPRFPADEALKLARVVGLDFDQDVKKKVCEMKGEDVILWDSVTRHRNGSLGHVSAECMLDTLHWAAKTAREQNTGAAQSLIESAHLIGDPTLLTALEALLNVLPPGIVSAGKKKPDANLAGAANDFEALERLRKLAFSETVPAPKIPEQLPLELADGPDSEEEDA